MRSSSPLHNSPPRTGFRTDGLIEVYRVQVGRQIYSPIEVKDFRRIPGFTLKSPVAPYGTELWRPAYQVINLQRYFNREVMNSFTRAEAMEKIREDALAMPVAPQPSAIRQWAGSHRYAWATVFRTLSGAAVAGALLFLALRMPVWMDGGAWTLSEKTSVIVSDMAERMDRFLTAFEP